MLKSLRDLVQNMLCGTIITITSIMTITMFLTILEIRGPCTMAVLRRGCLRFLSAAVPGEHEARGSLAGNGRWGLLQNHHA